MVEAIESVGLSLTAVRLMLEVTAKELSVPSLISQEIVRLVVLGFSEVFWYVTDSRADS